MKKKIVTVLMTAMLGSSILFAQTAMAADTAEQTEDTAKADETSEEKTEELKTIGEKPEKETEGILDVKLKNLTGKVITGFTIKNEKDEKYPDNFLKEDDKFAADEERELWFDLNKKDETSDAEKTEDAKTEENAENTEEKEIPKYNIQLTFEDGTTSEIHTFPFGDTEEAELHLEGSVAYLVFDSASQKKSINTLENEKALAPTPTAAPVAQPATESYDNSYEYNESYDYDNSYDYDDNSYDAAGSDDSGSDEGGSADGCLDNAILN